MPYDFEFPPVVPCFLEIEIAAVLSIRNGCAEYGLSGVRRHAEQLRAPYLIRVNIGSQWFPSFLIGLQPTYIPQISSHKSRTSCIICGPISRCGGNGSLRRRTSPNSVRRTPSSSMESSPSRAKFMYPSMVSMISSSAPARRSTFCQCHFPAVVYPARK